TILGLIGGSPVGFASLKGTDVLDMLYVHPSAAGHGVGTMLIDALEKLAAARGARRLIAEVSDSAQDFFKKRGFVPQQRNTVPLGLERSRPQGAARRQGRRHLFRGEVVGLPRAGRARDHARRKYRLDP